MKKIIALMVLFIVGASGSSVYCQSQEKQYALMILHFAKGIHWPNIPSKVFVVGVIDYEPLLPELIKTTDNWNINGKKIIVMPVSNLKDVENCQIIFIPAYKAKLLEKVLAHVKDHPVLIVSNKIDLTKKGGSIDLVLRNGKLTFDINSDLIESKGLKIGTSIKSAGNIVR
jgi:hypothetical protein